MSDRPGAAGHPRHVEWDYRHIDKVVTPQGVIEPGGARLKWYDIAPPGRPVAGETRRLARDFLVRQTALGTLDLQGDLGFVMLHLCGEVFHFLIVCTWRGSNELWETVYAKPDDRTADFGVFPRDRLHKPTYCVWEMGVVTHETAAWRAFLRSRRDAAAEADYLDALCSGAV